MESSQYILFSGAGFTKNFGGLLAKEMWSKIYNNSEVQGQHRLKNLLLSDFDYESIYHKVINGDYTDEEKDTINTAIYNAYQVLDDISREWTYRNDVSNPVNIYGVNKLIERFSGVNNEIGFFFTLNQDIFIERRFKSIKTAFIHPGVPNIPDAHIITSRLPIKKEDFIYLPKLDKLKTTSVNHFLKNTIHYVKLHGSFGWMSSKGANSYVIGKEKEQQVADEPLLSWYFELFKNALSKPNRKLFLIGYGFRDQHINEVFVDSIKKSGLRWFVISPSDQSEFISNLQSVKYGDILIEGLAGYFPYTLLDIFPKDQSESHAWKEILETYFVS
jgi:hypothetical protein